MDTKTEYQEIIDVAKRLTLLYVEDDLPTRKLMKRRLEEVFGSVWEATNGEEGLKRYRQGGIDLVISDNIMPVMDGIEMIREIRRVDSKLPIILTTAFIDTDYLMEAINLGVTQFVAKPVSMDKLLNAVKIAIQRVVLDALAQKAKEQEIELLRFQDRYHSLQQESAQRKERNMIKNDYYLHNVLGKGGSEEWMIDVLYRPLETLSGDSYSVRHLGEGKTLLIIIDGMGKGLSASVATTLSIAFLNYLIDETLGSGAEVRVEELVANYMRFIQKELLEEEVISAGFHSFDFEKGELSYITFGMPSVLLVDDEGHCQRVKSSSPPLMKYSQPPKSKTIPIDKIQKVLLYSDGLGEALVDENTFYGEYLNEDMLWSQSLLEMDKRFRSRVKDADDDITVFWVSRMPKQVSATRSYEIRSSLSDVHQLSDTIEEGLEEFGILDLEASTRFMTALTEMLMNAYEHGSLGVERLTKDRLIQEDSYDEYLASQGRVDRRIRVALKRYDQEDLAILSCEIEDEGAGFDAQELLQNLRNEPETLTSGRGIKLTKRLVDHLSFKKEGRVAHFLVVARQGASHGSH